MLERLISEIPEPIIGREIEITGNIYKGLKGVIIKTTRSNVILKTNNFPNEGTKDFAIEWSTQVKYPCFEDYYKQVRLIEP